MDETGLDPVSQERIARNDAAFRRANEEIEAAAVSLDFDPRAVPFICECADRSCTAVIHLSLDEYETVRRQSRWFLNVPGHQVAARGAAVVVDENERFVVVEKIAHAGEVVERLDERRAAAPAEEAGAGADG